MGKKILLADDSITIQKVIELTFSDEDFDVVTVGNGRLALEKLPEVRPDIVLCDIIMPEKDGYEVCEQIKSSAAFGHLPVLLLTGAFEPFDQERAAQVGSDGFLAKPFEPETLIAKVKDLLSRAGSAPGTVAPTAMAEATQVPEAAPLQAALSSAPAAAPPAPSPVIEPPAMAVGRASPSFIPDEPFESFDAGAIEEASATAIPEAPLAAVTAEESATLAGDFAGDFAGDLAEDLGAGQFAPDSASTVMFNAGDLPWTGGESAVPEPPALEEPVYEAPAAGSSESGARTAVPEPEPEPVFTPDPAEEVDLADAAGAAFEEVLEEDLEFSGRGAGEPSAAEPAMLGTGGSGPADSAATRTQAPVGPRGLYATDESPTLKVAVPALPEEVIFEHPAGESGPLETFEPGPVETYEPVARLEPEARPADELPSAPVFEPEPVETYEPVAPPEPASAFEPTLGETFEPVPEPDPAPPPMFKPAPMETFEPEPVESFEPEPEPAPPPMFEPEPAPVYEPEAVEPFEPVPPPEAEALAAPAFEPAPAYEPEPVETFEPIPPPAVSFEPAPVLEPEEELEDDLEPVTSETTSTLPGTTRADVVESFSDLGPGDEPDPVASEAAAVPVPVDMVEKIAQRVVAQVSEKAVREIAWEVIPDLAEALIKQEIERLKAELQKL